MSKHKADTYIALHLGHNASCAIIRDGEIAYVGQEERFTRKKNIMGFPKLALDHGMTELGLNGDDIAKVGFTSTEVAPLLIRSNFVRNFTVADFHSYYTDGYWARKLNGENVDSFYEWLRDDPKFNGEQDHLDYSFLFDMPLGDGKKLAETFREECVGFMSRQYGIARDKVEFLDHHHCHASYAYYASPFRSEDCAIVVMDGWGDGLNQSIWSAHNDQIKQITTSSQNDVGRVYKFATLILGMRPDEHEYKVMGLAPYSRQEYFKNAYEPLARLSEVKDMRVVEKDRPRDLYKYLRDAWETERFDNIAGATQLWTEEMLCKVFEDVHRLTGLRRFVFAGGIAMNVKANKKIAELPFVDEIFVPGSGADESLSIGGGYLLNAASGNNKPLANLYLGYNASDDASSTDWKALEKEFHVYPDFDAEKVADLLADGHVIARVSGRAEFGARALGNRSILADPSRMDSVRQINEAIKMRDFWMPFALSVLEEYSNDIIRNPKKISAPFMSIAFDSCDEHYAKVHAGSHPYDHTIRPQVVSKEAAPGYHDLIDKFRQRTGIPALLNTSFNLHGEPIVNTIDDAISTLRRCGLNFLLVDNMLVAKIPVDQQPD
ncbi:MAG: hypothetical protein JJ900_12865 [Rhodospirillales bacterium]|nr:hypothetical protein [Rhodospirillales bacterium]MBO6787737.1 hypothetical protein [Rhodospirillales bacterium]